jgi:hypothetical protein
MAHATEGASPTLSVSLVPPANLQISWPSDSVNWQLTSTTDLSVPNWQPVTQPPVSTGNALAVVLPITNLSRFFRLEQTGGGCAFQATPSVILSGASSTLSWCPVTGTSYTVSPGPGAVTGGSLLVSPTVTTVYTLTASNASGVVTSYATVIVNPCGWLQVSNWDATLDFSYALAPSTSSYNFSINHQGHITFQLMQQTSTATDAYFFGFATGGTASLNDREDDKTGPRVFTTTEVGSGLPVNVSYISLHVTCNSYDFSYSVLISTTETSDFGVTTSDDGVAAGAIVTRPLTVDAGTISDSEQLPAQYPPGNGDYFTPDSNLGKAMFSTGVVSNTTGGNASVSWSFEPVP